MSLEMPVDGLPGVAKALQAIAKRLGLSVTALVDAGGVANGSLVSIVTGNAKNADMAVGPLLRVLTAVGYELVGRGADEKGILAKTESGVELRILGPDGSRLEVAVDTLADLPLLLNTMAAGSWMTITGLVKAAGSPSSSLVGVARGTAGPNPDIRLNSLVQVSRAAQFELIIRPVHRSRREARIALAAARRS